MGHQPKQDKKNKDYRGHRLHTAATKQAKHKHRYKKKLTIPCDPSSTIKLEDTVTLITCQLPPKACIQLAILQVFDCYALLAHP